LALKEQDVATGGIGDDAVALVTGAGRGIGQAAASALATQGASVGVLARTAAEVERTAAQIVDAGGRAIPLVGDVTDRAFVTDAAARVRRAFGPVTVLVNGAGAMGPIGPDWMIEPAAWWRTFEVNVLGAFQLALAVLPAMIDQRRGYVVNLTSSAAYAGRPHTSAYGASKAALTAWTASLAQAAAPYNVRAFAFAPGFVRTRMTEGLTTAEARRWLGSGIGDALERGEAQPVSQVVEVLLFLLSGRADHLSGRHIDARDPPLDLLRMAEIEQRNLYRLSRRTFAE
jgi:NAD(P)-dependent dehydrogenase (short-subunit alcohol dehydrogenase family)